MADFIGALIGACLMGALVLPIPLAIWAVFRS
jgi:hypothetical protein